MQGGGVLHGVGLFADRFGGRQGRNVSQGGLKFVFGGAIVYHGGLTEDDFLLGSLRRLGLAMLRR